MKRIIVILAIVMAWTAGYSQEAPYKFDLGGGLGMSGYLGDANNSSLFKHPGITAEAGMRYIADARWAFRGVLGLTTISGNTADYDNVLPGGAEYSFSSKIFSFDARAEFNFLPYGIGETYKKLSRWTPYVTIGVGACMSSGNGTSCFAPTLPMGVGVKYKLAQRLNLGLEFTMTKAFGDKIDSADLTDLAGIKSSFVKNTDWFSRLTIGITYEFGERCQTCNYVD